MRFAKMHGLGNDFVLIDLRGAPAGTAAPDEAFARRVCDRHRGVGADGILTLLDAPGSGAQAARLIIHNPDGSRPEMCGNGARCAALWIASDRCTRPGRGEVLLLTDAGERRCQVDAAGPDFSPALGSIEIGMGPPRVEPARTLSLGTGTHEAIPVSMGNPHRVLFFDELPRAGLASALAALCAKEGPALCAAEDANIELVRWLGHDAPAREEAGYDPALFFVASVWERGAGATEACGTGACAIAAAAIARGIAKAGDRIVVRLPGGALTLRLQDGEMKMRGPAQLVFQGTLDES